MSWKHMMLAYKTPGLTATQRLVLGALGSHANEEGTCFPHLATLAKETALAAPTISTTCKELVAAKIIIRKRSQIGNHYVFPNNGISATVKSDFSRDEAGFQRGQSGISSTAKSHFSEGEVPFQPGRNALNRPEKGQENQPMKQPKNNNPPPSSSGGGGVGEGGSGEEVWFEQFWENYPKQTNKPAAKASFQAALARGADGPAIVEAARVAKCFYAQTDPRYIPAPYRWLDREAYAEPDFAPRPQRNTPPPASPDFLEAMRILSKGMKP